jgi:hypothetical protein
LLAGGASTTYSYFNRGSLHKRALPDGYLVIYSKSLYQSPQFYQSFDGFRYLLSSFEEVKGLWSIAESHRREKQSHILHNAPSGIPRSRRQRAIRAKAKKEQEKE